MENKPAGLFDFIRRTSFLSIFLDWIGSIILFGLIYWVISLFSTSLMVDQEALVFTITGIFKAIYASFLAATLFGIIKLDFSAFTFFIYIQAIFTGIVLLILIDKAFQKWVFPHYHITTSQDKKIHTIMLMISIFRNDIDKIKYEFKARTKRDINLKEIEAIVDGLYVTFLDIENLFSVKNIHRHKIKDMHYLMVVMDVEEALEKLSSFIDFLEQHKIEWKDKHIEFWLRYILETADKIALSIDTEHIKKHKVIIAVENIKEHVKKIENKI